MSYHSSTQAQSSSQQSASSRTTSRTRTTTTTTTTTSASTPAQSSSYLFSGTEQVTLAPLGYHFMPDGNLMSDVKHIETYGGKYKIIEDIIIDTSDISISKIKSLPFKIIGENGAVFSLQVKDVDNNKFYDFETSTFVSEEKMLSRRQVRGFSFNGTIKFPTLSAATKYEIYLLADYVSGTKHADYSEVRDVNGDIDVNASKGSSSLILYKEIYQTASQVLTITPVSVTSNTNFTSATMASSAKRINYGGSLNKASFELKVTQANGKAVRIDRQPTAADFAGRAATTLDAEVADYTADYDGVMSHYWLGTDNDAVATPRSTDTVNGDFSGGTTKIVMDSAVSTKMKVGDRVTGTGIPAAAEITVAALNPDTDNANEFSVSSSVEVADGTTLSFTPPHYFRYTSNSNILDIPIGASLVGGDADGITALTNTSGVITAKVNDLEFTRSKSRDRDNTTKIAAASRLGNITFDKKLPEDIEGEDFFFYGYGAGNIKTICGWDIEISNVKAELTTVTTTVTSSSGTSLGVTSGHGIMDDVSVVSSPNMNRAVANPTVTNIGSYNVSSAATATLTLSSSQTLETGETVTFSGAGQIVTITGDILVRNAGVTSTIFLDIDNFLTGTTETA